MRVLHTVHAYPPDVGGSEAVVERFSQGLVDRGHEVEVATSEHPDRGREVDGVRVFGFADNPAGWGRYRRFVHAGLDEDRWDVVMTYHSKVWTHLALAPFGKVGPRWVYVPTEFTDIDSLHPRHLVYYRTLEPLSIRRAARTLVLTRLDERRATELAGEERRPRIRRLPNGVDHTFWSAGEPGDVLERYELPTNVPYMMYAGGLWEHKDVETLVDALDHLDDAHLLIVGSTKGRGGQLRSRARSLGVSRRVHMLGRVPREDLRALYHASHVHASASVNEGFGLTFLEAMACGLPVVAREVGVIPELVDEGADVTVAHDATSFARAIQTAIEEGSTRNVEISKRYDWEAILDQLVEIYEAVREEASP